MSLRARLGLAAGVAVALAVVAVAVSAYAGTRSQLRGQVDAQLQTLSRQVLGPQNGGGPPGARGGGPGGIRGQGLGLAGQRCEPPGEGDECLGIDQRAGQAFGGAAGIVTLVYRGGGIYIPRLQSSRVPVDARMRALARTGKGRYFTDLHIGGHHIRVLVQGIGQDGALAVALPLTDVDKALSNQLLLLGIIGAAGIALAALLGLLVARTALAPIARFTRQTETIATQPELIEQQRLDVTGKDELARLARTFNSTLDALERSIQSQRNLVADASHELRTPIATIRANLQLMRDEALLSPEDRDALRADVIQELDELTALVGDVVELARGSKPSPEPGDVRVDQIATEVVARAERRAPQIEIHVELEPTLVSGEGDRIARAITNLVDNACKWSRPGSTIDVTLRGGRLTVRDHGPGFHDADLPFVFDRFHRAKDARGKPGSGLGLAIVRQAAEAHGGSVRAGNAPDGGAVLEVSFGRVLQLGEDGDADALGVGQGRDQQQ